MKWLENTLDGSSTKLTWTHLQKERDLRYTVISSWKEQGNLSEISVKNPREDKQMDTAVAVTFFGDQHILIEKSLLNNDI